MVCDRLSNLVYILLINFSADQIRLWLTMAIWLIESIKSVNIEYLAKNSQLIETLSHGPCLEHDCFGLLSLRLLMC